MRLSTRKDCVDVGIPQFILTRAIYMITCIKYSISFVIMLFALSGYPLYIIAAWPLVLLLFSLCCSKTNKEGQLEDYLLNEAYVLYIILNVQQYPSIIFRKYFLHIVFV